MLSILIIQYAHNYMETIKEKIINKYIFENKKIKYYLRIPISQKNIYIIM